jgi:dihydroorotate dehydrogenase
MKHTTTFAPCPVSIGGVSLPYPFILAAGFVKGHGFDDEAEALNAVHNGINIMPGWRSMPTLVGPVEFGSFTRWPRLGNSGVVMWRDTAARSTQNRVGLKNPGVKAAATFLDQQRDLLPPIFGINIAVTPGVTDPQQECDEILQALDAFLSRTLHPSWITLNLSCPNTEYDPSSHQTEQKARSLCAAAVQHLGKRIPLWVKISPGLAANQYSALMRVFAEVSVRAVIATNTLPQPVPGDSALTAGAGGGRLHAEAVTAARHLMNEKRQHGYPVDVIGCGGVDDPTSYQDFARLGVNVVQYWSVLIYRGPLAAALLLDEMA